MKNLRFVFALFAPAIVAGAACTVNNGGVSGGGTSPCDQLAAKCPYCTIPNLKQSCEGAVNGHDPSACQNGLNDRDVQTNCVPPSSGGSTSSGGASSSSSSGGASSSSSSSSGSSGTGDAAVTITDTCKFGHDCVCPPGAKCNFTCSAVDSCNAECQNGSVCTVQCGAGSCNLQCGANATCTENCSSGSCDGNGNGSASMQQNCSSGSCDLTCISVVSCKQALGTGTHSCAGCN